jgi:hypothetical protein
LKTEILQETPSVHPSHESVSPVPEQPGPLEALLKRPPVHASDDRGDPSARRESGVRLGVLQGFDEQGQACVQIDGQVRQQVCAGALVALRAQDVGQRVALGFEDADTQRPLILGLLLEAPGAAMHVSGTGSVSIERQGTHTLIEAGEELELRCGEAVILLQADGRIDLRGTYITSHAHAGQRIRGGSVQIN